MHVNTLVADNEELTLLRERCAELEEELQSLRHVQGKRLQIAADVHRSLLPGPIRGEQIWADVRYIPIEEVGGDYCQIRFSDKCTCYITMCDVMGHGVGAALLATRISSEVRYGIMYRQEPRDIVNSLERFMQEHFSHTDLFLTFIAVKIDLDRRELTWTGAGHPSPFVLRPGSQEPLQLPSQSSIIGVGITDGDAVGQDTLALEPGDRLFLFTDGLFEALDEEERPLGLEGFIDIAKTTMGRDLFEVADGVLEGVAEYQYGPNTDDQTLAVVEIR